MSNTNSHNYPFSINDITYVINDALTIRQGRITSIPHDEITTYGVYMLDNSSVENFNFAQMFGLHGEAQIHIQQFLITPTPTISVSTTPHPSRTPKASATPTPTPSSSTIHYPNLLGDVTWQGVNGIVTINDDDSIKFTSTNVTNSVVKFISDDIFVDTTGNYNFNIRYLEGTCQYAYIEIMTNSSGVENIKLFSALLNQNDITSDPLNGSGYLTDNIKIPEDIFAINIIVTLYNNSNYNNYPKNGYDYTIKTINLVKYIPYEIKPSPSPTNTLTPTPTMTPSLTSNITPLSIPNGFDWIPPINIYSTSDNIFSTDYNSADYIPITTAELWVSTTGNDTTGNGSQALPYASIKKALTQAIALPDDGIHIRINAGLYDFNHVWGNISVPKNLVVTSEGGQVISSTRASVSWTLQGDGTFKATRTSVAVIYDTTQLSTHGYAKRLIKVSDQVTCSITQNSFYTDGTSVYVNTIDSRIPTNNEIIVLLGVTNGVKNVDNDWYIKGITFECGNSAGPFNMPTTGNSGNLIFDNCQFNYGYNKKDGLLVYGANLVILNNCIAHDNEADGFGYHQGSTNLISPKSVEINCTSYDNGNNDGVNNYNGFTSHENCRVVRVNAKASGNVGPQIVDIDTAQSWNLGCIVGPSASTNSTTISTGAYYSGADTASMWLDQCIGNSYYVIVTTGNASMYIRGGDFTGLRAGSNIATY